MNEADATFTKPRRQWAAVLLMLAASVIGAGLGYDFGRTLGGALFGVLTAAAGALFCSILADALATRVLGALAR